jgi:hypothetical protein
MCDEDMSMKPAGFEVWQCKQPKSSRGWFQKAIEPAGAQPGTGWQTLVWSNATVEGRSINGGEYCACLDPEFLIVVLRLGPDGEHFGAHHDRSRLPGKRVAHPIAQELVVLTGFQAIQNLEVCHMDNRAPRVLLACG